MSRAENMARLDEATAFLMGVEKKTLCKSFVALVGFYGIALGDAGADTELGAKMRTGLSMVMSPLPLEVTELILSAILDEDITNAS